jgi:hypothetical protein
VSTRRNLGVVIHQHFGYRIHCTWDGAFGNRSFERRFSSYNSVLGICTSVTEGTPECLCTCITPREELFDGEPGTLIEILFDKVSPCRVSLPPLPEWLDVPWSTVRLERVYQESDAGATRCTCNAMSMEAVFK